MQNMARARSAWLPACLGILLLSTACVLARTCPGAPCSDNSFCRSEFGFCNSGPDWCNERSTWNSTGCLLLPENGCAGVPCLNPLDCRSADNNCGQGPTFCNANSLHRPEGCGTTSAPTLQTSTPTLATSAPTIATSTPTVPTKTPTAPTTQKPTTSSPITSSPVTRSPSVPGATLTPVTLRPTLSPTLPVGGEGGANTASPTTSTAGSSSSVPIAVGASVAVLAIAGVIFATHRKRVQERKSLEEVWTVDEERRLRDAFQKTHDFEELCKVVPNRSRESVAIRAKHLIEPRRTKLFHSFVVRPMEGYAFVAERARKFVPSSFSSNRYHRNLNRDTTGTTASNLSFQNQNGTLLYSGPASMAPPKGFGMRESDNPLYFQDY